MTESLDIALQQLAERMQRLDEEWRKRAMSSYQHHEIATSMVMLWLHQAEEMLRLLYGTEKQP
jgi:hypothetical protein